MKLAAKSLWAIVAAASALIYLTVMLVTGALPQNRQIISFKVEGVLTQSPERVDRIEITLGAKSATFSRKAAGWAEADGAPVEPARAATLDRALKIMYNSGPVRVMPPEETAGSKPESYGFSSAGLSVKLSGAGVSFLQAEFGNKNTDSVLQYMRLAGRGELYLMSGFVGKAWEAAVAQDKK